MPYIHLKHTCNVVEKIDAKEIMEPCHEILVQHLGANLLFCQSYITNLEKYYIGDGNRHHAFVHLEVSLKEGRPIENLSKAGQHLLEHLQHYFRETQRKLNLQIGVNIIPFQNPLYFN